jgi:subtilisin-like proprotein convertase family protein
MSMNTNQLTAALAAGLLWAGLARGQTATNSFTFATGQNIPVADVNGLALTYNLSGLAGPIGSVAVSLNISGGDTGDLYAYLTGPNGGFSVLLNRSGVTTGNSFGYSDTGFNVTLSDAAANSIQNYQTVSYSLDSGSGQLLGAWQPSGLNIDPQSAPSLFASTSPTALLSSFDGSDPNGTWTLFLEDPVAGDQSVLQSATTIITTVPEPATGALAALGGVVMLLLRLSQMRGPR